MPNTFQNEGIYGYAAKQHHKLEGDEKIALERTNVSREAAQMSRTKNLGLPSTASLEEIEAESTKLMSEVKSRERQYK